MKPQCAISVDLDPLSCYYQIHGLGAEPGALSDLIIRRCLPRFASLFGQRGIPATFFVVGRDVDVAANGATARSVRSALRDMVSEGHEIANHSYSHPYRLSRLPPAELRDEIARAHELLSKVAGTPVVGFRAPGYDVSAQVLEVLCELGYLYDSSVLPAPGYYTAKALIMTAMAATGRKSGAVLTDPRNVLARSDPYRPSLRSPWRTGDAPLVEIPITVTAYTRTPAIGTTLLLSPPWLQRQWISGLSKRRLWNLEFHGIDLADAEEDGIPGELVRRQPDLRKSLAEKVAVFGRVLDQMLDLFQFVPTRQAAAEAARRL